MSYSEYILFNTKEIYCYKNQESQLVGNLMLRRDYNSKERLTESRQVWG